MTAAEIRWGVGFDNIIHFDPFDVDGNPHVLDNQVSWRKPSPGSRRARNDAGVTDAWIRSRDFVLAGQARYFGGQSWGGAGLQDFLDWAGEGNAFRYIPDRRYPDFYVADCYLEEPFDDPRPQLEDNDGSQSIDIVIRQQAFDFTLARRGLMFEYVPGKSITDPSAMLATFTRSTIGKEVPRSGTLSEAAINALRDHHFIDGDRHALLELERANLCLQSRDLTTTWTGGATTAFDAVGLDGTANSATTVTDDDPAAHENKTQVVTIPNDSNPVAVGFWIKKDSNETRFAQLGFSITGGTAKQIRASFNTATGAYVASNSVGGGGTIRITDYAEDWWLVEVIITNNSTGNTAANLVVYPAARTALAGSDDVAAVGSIVVGQVQVEVNSGFVTSPIFTTTVSVTRGADALTFPFAFAPQEMTVYLKFRERGTSEITDGRYFQISSTANAAPALYLVHNSSGDLEAAHLNGTGVVGTSGSLLWEHGDLVEVRLALSSAGVITLAYAVNEGAETVIGTSSNLALASAWSGNLLGLNSVPGGTPGAGAVALQVARVAVGVRTLAQLRAA